LSLLAGAGLEMALVNVLQSELMATFQQIRQMTREEGE
jgi:hypothetical protein